MPVAAVVGDRTGDAVEVELVAEVDVVEVAVLVPLPVEVALMVCPVGPKSDHWEL